MPFSSVSVFGLQDFIFENWSDLQLDANPFDVSHSLQACLVLLVLTLTLCWLEGFKCLYQSHCTGWWPIIVKDKQLNLIKKETKSLSVSSLSRFISNLLRKHQEYQSIWKIGEIQGQHSKRIITDVSTSLPGETTSFWQDLLYLYQFSCWLYGWHLLDIVGINLIIIFYTDMCTFCKLQVTRTSTVNV